MNPTFFHTCTPGEVAAYAATKDFGLLVMITRAEELAPLFQTLCKKAKVHFAMHLPAALLQQLDAASLDCIFTLASLPHYLAYGAGGPVFVCDDASADGTVLANYFAHQGSSIEILSTNNSSSATSRKVYQLATMTTTEEVLQLTANVAAATRTPLFILNPSTTANQWPAVTALQQVLCAKAAWEAAEQNLYLYKQRSQLYLHFIALGNKVAQQEYQDLVRWYQKEYEQLPLWYKRFGHLLKVISGKRSFKSLFDD